MEKEHNDRGAGRKPNGYESKKMTVPVDLIPSFQQQIAKYKIEVNKNAKHDTSKTS